MTLSRILRAKMSVGQRRSLKRVPLHSAETFIAVLPECRSCPCFLAAFSRSRRHKLHIVHFRASTKSSLIPLLLLSPKSHSTFRGPRLFSQNHIPFRRSFSCSRLISGNKKAGTFDIPTNLKKDRIIPLILVVIKCTGYRLCDNPVLLFIPIHCHRTAVKHCGREQYFR